jgi:hypothetical protein
MTKLMDLKGSENLPQKQQDPGYLLNFQAVGKIEGINETIDKYNSLSIDGDIEALAKHLYENVYKWGGWNNADSIDRRNCLNDAKCIIANLGNFVVIMKG